MDAEKKTMLYDIDNFYLVEKKAPFPTAKQVDANDASGQNITRNANNVNVKKSIKREVYHARDLNKII